jgi:HEAT repeat protein
MRRRHSIAALAHNASTDPVASVRARNLLALVRAHPRHETTAEALRAACRDSSAEVRVRAGIALGAEGDPTLIEVAAEESADDAWRAEAISALGVRMPYWRAQAILERARGARAVQTAQGCLAAVAASGAGDVVATLANVLRTASGEVAVAAARALGQRRAGEAEGPLLESLGSDDAALRIAVAEALAKVGTAHAVVALKEAAAADPHHRALQRAVRQAVVEIQSRLTGASPGQLSLASPAGGALSLSEADAGQLSFDGETPRSGGGSDPQ